MNPEETPTQNVEAVARKFDDVAYVMNPERSELHYLNATAIRVWELVDGRRSVADIAGEIALEYEIDAHVAVEDVSELLAAMAEKDLIRMAPA